MTLPKFEDKPPKKDPDTGKIIHVKRCELRPGDVLFSYGEPEDFWATPLVRFFDNGDYSHISFFDGEHSLDAAYKKKITPRRIEEIVHLQRYVDVYRFRSDDGHELDSAGWPSSPVTEAGRVYIGHGYGGQDAMLAALLLLTRRVNLPGEIEKYVRFVLSAAIRFLSDLVYDDSRAELITCSELPYRAYHEAENPPRYRLRIRGRFDEAVAPSELPEAFSLLPGGGLGYNVVREPSESFGDEEIDELAKDFWRLYQRVRPPRVTIPLDLPDVDAGSLPTWLASRVEAGAIELPIEADFVSPFDLYTSPNLVEVGRAFKEDFPLDA